MDEMLSILIEQLENKSIKATKVIPWSCPVPSFGDFSQATVATLGLNPSNREFVDESGKELEGHGVTPDVAVELDIKVLRGGKDPDIVAASRWIKEKP